jgi:hypothetical protein
VIHKILHAESVPQGESLHTYRLLTDQAELDKHLVPILEQNGSEIPAPSCYVAAVEFDEAGNVVAYQMLQNAIFLEGLWAKDNSAHLLRLYHMANEFAEKRLGAKRIMTMTRRDEAGERIGRVAQKLGLEDMKWNVYRRKI